MMRQMREKKETTEELIVRGLLTTWNVNAVALPTTRPSAPREPHFFPLLPPRRRKRLHQPLPRQPARLLGQHDRLDDIRRQERQAENAADMNPTSRGRSNGNTAAATRRTRRGLRVDYAARKFLGTSRVPC